MEVALLGGSFNPPHVGHLLAAQYIHATQRVDKVWLMPTFRHPFGKASVEYEHRLRMCQLVAEETSGWLEVSDVERQLGGDGRTVDTLSFLTERMPHVRFSLVIGSDILKDLPSWKDFPRIQQLARVLVLYRAGFPAQGTVGPPLSQVSSTEIRQAMEAGQDVSPLVPWRVLQYAREHRLFGAGQ